MLNRTYWQAGKTTQAKPQKIMDSIKGNNEGIIVADKAAVTVSSRI